MLPEPENGAMHNQPCATTITIRVRVFEEIATFISPRIYIYFRVEHPSMVCVLSKKVGRYILFLYLKYSVLIFMSLWIWFMFEQMMNLIENAASLVFS